MNKSIKPENILSDEESFKVIDGVRVRKGSIRAVIVNAGILSSNSSTAAEKQAALSVIKELAPTMVVLGVYEHLQWKNSEIQKIVEEAARALNRL